jgi:hypothetical protein
VGLGELVEGGVVEAVLFGEHAGDLVGEVLQARAEGLCTLSGLHIIKSAQQTQLPPAQS